MKLQLGLPIMAPLLCTLAACTSSPLSPNELLALGEAEARWAARPFEDYSYETVTSCGECPDVVRQWARVAVSNGMVVGVVLIANDSVLSDADLISFTTVDGLFAQIRRYQHEDWVRDVSVTFDPELGYPTSISSFAKAGIMDAGASRLIRNLLPL
jgi:Family of unknown function (DUF6174)